MQKTYEFLKECGPFFVLTTHQGAPVGRPFGAVMEYQGELYICTGKNKEVYAQLKAGPDIQIVALKPGTREWLRLSARAQESESLDQKREMFRQCPVLEKRYDGPESENFALFCLKEPRALYCTDAGKTPID